MVILLSTQFYNIYGLHRRNFLIMISSFQLNFSSQGYFVKCIKAGGSGEVLAITKFEWNVIKMNITRKIL